MYTVSWFPSIHILTFLRCMCDVQPQVALSARELRLAVAAVALEARVHLVVVAEAAVPVPQQRRTSTSFPC